VLAIQQPANWPRIWSTAAEEDLQTRLSRLPFYAPTGFGGVTVNGCDDWGPDAYRLARMLKKAGIITGGPCLDADNIGLGGVVEDIQAILQKAPDLLAKGVQIINQAGPYLDTILQVVQDPALPQLVDRIKTLQTIEAAKPSTPTAAATPGTAPVTPTTNTGISKLIPALDAAIFLDKHPAAQFALDHPVLVGAGAAVILAGIGIGIGIGVGRLTKKCAAVSVGSADSLKRAKRYRRRR